MSEEKIRFMFALSADGTKQLQEGTLTLSSGGLRRPDGSMYEMATPVYLDPDSFSNRNDLTEREKIRFQVELATNKIDQTMKSIEGLQNITWMNYAVNCQTYEMTYQGFVRVIGQLDYISAQLKKAEMENANKEFNDRVERVNEYKNNLNSIAGFMDRKSFNASDSFMNVVKVLDGLAAYFERLYNEMIARSVSDQILLWSVFNLIGPYSYVIRRYSALYYFENDDYPPNYNIWVNSISKIVKNRAFKLRIQYFLRLNSDCSLEDVFISTIQNKYCSDPRYIERVVFHPDYTYSDFVGQILPKVENGFLKYEFSAGPFTKVMKKAYEDPGNYYYLIIEELNRGNAPAIFGEIFQLLDRKEDEQYAEETIGESEYAITNFEIADIVFGDREIRVRIPSNLFILATMNTSDQNVFTLDTAFQRRWHMKHIRNDVRLAKHANMLIEGSVVDWGTFAEVINEEILKITDGIASLEDKRLGAYFVTGKELGTEPFSEKVLKYLWDDAFKMDHDYIFSEGMNSLDMVISTYQKSKNDCLGAVLRAGIYNEMIRRMKGLTSQNGIISENDNN